jgi:hypothetical protein
MKNNQRRTRTLWQQSERWSWAVIACLMLAAPMASAQDRDICGCRDSVTSFGDFVASDPATWTAVGATAPTAASIVIPLPDDGVMIFDSFNIDSQSGSASGVTVSFARNLSNTPVRILVKGDLTLAAGSIISLNGAAGGAGSGSQNGGLAGLGGPGGSRGGQGAYAYLDGHNRGGQGLGAGGSNGNPGGTFYIPSSAGIFVGETPTLLPLSGGSGGGGGGSSTTGTSCKGGGGGGGGGAMLVSSNGAITVNGVIRSNGGTYGAYGSSTCARVGSAGSGGAIRLVANTIAGSGTLQATGGAIRVESFEFTLPAANSSPTASYVNAPGPVFAPIVTFIGIATINGADTSENNGELLWDAPAGALGGVDITIDVPGEVAVDIITEGVPSGTILDLNVKPVHGDDASTVSVTIDPADCNAAGDCSSLAIVPLVAGTFYLEAEATFQTP